MKKIFEIIFLLCFLNPLTSAQNDNFSINENSFVVDSISIRGNEITKGFIILRELTFSVGDSITTKVLEFNRERVYSLGIFNFVNMYRDSISTGMVVIDVNETWYVYPIPFYRLNNEKARYGVRTVWKNFRGRNEKISVMVSLGYNPYYQVIYSNPLVDSKNDLSLDFSSTYQWAGNPSKEILRKIRTDFEYKYFANAISIGKRFDPFNELFLTLGYLYIEAPENYQHNVTISGSRIDKYPYSGISYLYDTRDLKLYALTGSVFYTSYMYKGFGIDNISHSIFSVDYRKYLELFNTVSQKFRIAGRHCAGTKIPIYDLSYLGYQDYIRGHKDDVREGRNMLITSYELDIPIIKEWDLTVDLPLLPTRLTSARIGVHISAFVDAGTVFDNFDNVNNLDFDTGYGLGINLLFLPHAGLRLEYAFNENGHGEFLIGTGLSF